MITDTQLKELEGLSRYVRRIQEVSISPYGDYGFALEVSDDGLRLLTAEVENKYICSAVNLVPSLIERLKGAEAALEFIVERDRGRGYPTGIEWIHIMNIVNEHFDKIPKEKKG